LYGIPSLMSSDLNAGEFEGLPLSLAMLTSEKHK